MDFATLIATAPTTSTDGASPRKSYFSRKLDKPTKNARKHGHIEGIQVGDTFKDRRELYMAGGHNRTRAGICGDAKEGLFAIVANSGYEDDTDSGNTIEYTGAGGRDLSNSWSGPQIKDQDYDGINRAFKRAVETGNPVRVFRGPQLKSKWAPHHCYRYDGLYDPIRTWREAGKTSLTTCRILLQRQADQPPIPIRDPDERPPPRVRRSPQKKTIKCEEGESKPILKREPDDNDDSLSPPTFSLPPITIKREPQEETDRVPIPASASVEHEANPQAWFASLPRLVPEETASEQRVAIPVQHEADPQVWFASLPRLIPQEEEVAEPLFIPEEGEEQA